MMQPDSRRDASCRARLLAVTLPLLAAAGCSERTGIAPRTLESIASSQAAGGWTALAPPAALLRLPQPATAVAERRAAQGFVQDIELPSGRGLGRNRLVLAVYRDAPVAGLGPSRPTEAGVGSELAEAFPGKAMRIVPQPRRNAFGPYGLAVGSGPGRQRCIYAWQWLDRDDGRIAGRLDGDASWRARICRNDMSLDQLAETLDRIDLGAQAPDAGMLEPPAARPRPIAAARKPAGRPQAAPKAAREPSETGSTSAPGGRRYLAPVAGLAGRADVPRVPAGAPSGATALDASLPAEAYRGPMPRNGPYAAAARRDAAVPGVAVPTPD